MFVSGILTSEQDKAADEAEAKQSGSSRVAVCRKRFRHRWSSTRQTEHGRRPWVRSSAQLIQMIFRPLAESRESWKQAFAERRQMVLDARRNGGMDGSAD